MKILKKLIVILAVCVLFTACGKKDEDKKGGEEKEITILAAASLTDVCGELKAEFEKNNPDIKLTFSFGSSGALQTQIEEGAPCDVFFSAAEKQINALKDEGLLDENSIKTLLENKIVLVVPKGNAPGLKDFSEVTGSSVNMIALGDPESVPAGQYAEEVFTTLGILDDVKKKANYGSDVRTVLSWVESGDADCGVVYATDAFTTDKVEIVAYAPEGSCKRVLYPAAVIKASANKEAAQKFLDYLSGADALKLFEKYGFAAA